MATKTTNYNFNKPEMNDYASMEVLAETFDEIDEALKGVEDKLDNLDIPTPDVSGQIKKHNDAEDAHSETLAKKNHTHTASEVGAAASGHTHVPSEVGISYGTSDLTAGTSSLESGRIYLVYE
jgi:hypothetical protein